MPLRLLVLAVLPLAGWVAVTPAAAAPSGAAVRVSVLAEGLDNPRGLDVTSRGVLVAQAGRGGSGPCLPNPEDPATPSCLGSTGKISLLSFDGRRRDVVTGLPSLASAGGDRALGPSDVTEDHRGTVRATVGLGADPTSDDVAEVLSAAPRLASLLALDHRSRPVTVADLGAHEIAENPLPPLLDTNPNSGTTGPGVQVVADAGANALLQVRGGKVSTLAVFPDTSVDAPPFLGLPPGTQIPMQAVPNSVVRGPDGAYYVGQLTGFPFPVGGAKVWRVVADQAPEVYASGFTNIIDLAFRPGGELLVLEIRHEGLLSEDRSGALLSVPPGGGERPVVLLTAPLTEPTGLAVRGHTAYVSDRGTEARTGRVLRIGL